VTFRDFEAFIESLNAERVRYLIVGGYAVAFHGRPRATKDIDVLVDRSRANAIRVLAALERFFGSKPKISLAKLMNPRTLVVLGVAPIRIDILTAIDGVPSFSAAWKRRVEGRYSTARANFISAEDLVASKLAAGRPQDLADVDVLRRASARKRGARR
jgi:hypothetical protein